MQKQILFHLCLLSLIPNLCLAQFNEQHIIVNPELLRPLGIHSADLDGDGDSDVLSASQEDHKIAWYQNQGKGNFSEQIVISTNAIDARSVYTADLDNDGDLDVISASSGDNKIAWYQNDGKGNFSEEIIISTNAESAKSVYSADLDKDGDLDIISASSGDNKIAWYQNDGKGNFSEETIISLNAENTIFVRAADLDGDNDMDVVYTSWRGNKIAWYQNDGEGNFSEELLVTERVERPVSLVTDDIDRDGDLDIISASWEDNKIAWYQNDGKGNFLKQIVVGYAEMAVAVYTQDMDNDGDLDILYASFRGSIAYVENDGKGNFSEPIFVRKTSNFLNNIFPADLNQDGKIDVIALIRTLKSRLVWYQNKGDKTFVYRSLFSNKISEIRSIAKADIDGDGDIDVLSASAGDNKIAWYENDSKTLFEKQHIISTQIRAANSIQAVDLDKDNDIDVLASSDEAVFWFINNGKGGFSSRRVINNLEGQFIFIHIADFDNDDDTDILTYSRNDGIMWHENISGNFSNSKKISNDEAPVPVFATLADLDKDGNIDIISTSVSLANKWVWDSGEVFWMKNDGEGNFSKQKIIPTRSSHICIADMDNDNDLDIISSELEQVVVYENNGSELFSKQKIIEPDNHPLLAQRNYAFDLEGDGDMDIFSTSDWDLFLAWYENDGNHNFSPRKIISTEPKPNTRSTLKHGVCPTDLDNDGDMEVLYFLNDKIAWYENLFDYPSISGTVFWDENGNKKLDSLEKTLKNIPVSITPNAIGGFTNEHGYFRFFISNDTRYKVTLEIDSCWQLSTDSLKYDIALNGNVASNLNFGLNIASNYEHAQIRISSAPTRCGFEVPFQLSIENDGCLPINGVYGIVLDSILRLNNTEIEPFAVRGDTLFWLYETLVASELEDIQLSIQMPDANFIGETITLTGLSYIQNEDGKLELSETYQYQSEIRCAYDPNDKLTSPNRLNQYEQNYTLFEEPIEYTIRFQNTGNDTAFNIIIRDTLDNNLDWTTFKPISGSHPFETFLHKDGQIEFSFNDILLPDSTTNELLSHGFVTYKILSKEGLLENTILQNKASIYFDFNPPIVTNTTENIMVSEFPIETSKSSVIFPPNLKIYPNPFKDYIIVQNEYFRPNEVLKITLFDITGKQIQSSILNSPNFSMSTTKLNVGFYFYLISNNLGEVITNGKLLKNS